jgi:chorismate mutase
VPATVRALRGATTVEEDSRDQIHDRVSALFGALFERNGIHHDDLISIVLTMTGDLHAMFPAEAARAIGLGDVPLICAQELDIDGATPRCIRVLIHLTTERGRAELRHVYLEGASGLRDDLPG